MHTCIYVVALGVVDPFVAFATSLASLVAIPSATPGARVDDEIPLPLYILSGRSGNDSIPYETVAT